jgi:hypothetical protein
MSHGYPRVIEIALGRDCETWRGQRRNPEILVRNSIQRQSSCSDLILQTSIEELLDAADLGVPILCDIEYSAGALDKRHNAGDSHSTFFACSAVFPYSPFFLYKVLRLRKMG